MAHVPKFLDETNPDPVPLDRASIPEAQRIRLLRAMIRLCAQRGYAAVAVDELCTVANVAPSTFRALFADKADCYRAAQEQAYAAHFAAIEEERLAWEADPAAPRSFRGLYGALMRGYWGAAAADPDVAHALGVDSYQVGADVIQRRVDSNGQNAAVLAAVHDRFGGRPLLDGEAGFLIDLIVGFTTIRVAAGDADALPGRVDPYVEIVDRWLTTPPPSAPPPPRPAATGASPRSFLDDLRTDPPRLEAASVGAATRLRLLRTLSRLCTGDGHATVTLERLLQEADVAPRAFDRCFADLEDCRVALSRHASATVLARDRAALACWRADPAAPRTLEAALLAILAEHCAALAADPALAHAYAVEPLATGPVTAGMRRALHRRLADGLIALQAELGGRPLGVLEATMVIELLAGVQVQRVASGHAADLPALAAPLARVVATWLS